MSGKTRLTEADDLKAPGSRYTMPTWVQEAVLQRVDAVYQESLAWAEGEAMQYDDDPDDWIPGHQLFGAIMADLGQRLLDDCDISPEAADEHVNECTFVGALIEAMVQGIVMHLRCIVPQYRAESAS